MGSLSRKMKRKQQAKAPKGHCCPSHDAMLNDAEAAFARYDVVAAEAAYKAFLMQHPNDAQALQRYGELCMRAKLFGDATQFFDKAGSIEATPERVALLITAMFRAGQDEKAMGMLQQAQGQLGDNAHLLRAAAEMAKAQGELATAVELLTKAIALDETIAELHFDLGMILGSMGRQEDARAAFEQAIARDASHLPAMCNIGIMLHQMGDNDAAKGYLNRVLRVNAGFMHALVNLSYIAAHEGEYAEGIRLCEAGLAHDPKAQELLMRLISLKHQLCDWGGMAELETRLKEQLAKYPDMALHPYDSLLLGLSPAQQYAAARRTAEAVHVGEALDQTRDLTPDRRLKIGYFSADMHEHATAYLMREMFQAHDAAQFETYLYSWGMEDGSAIRGEIKDAADHFVEVSGASEAEIAQRAQADGIDIAVDLKGYTKDSRFRIFAHRPAPIQVNYLGHPATTAADWMDYIIADKVILPAEDQPHFSEAPIYLPGCYQINDSQRAIGEAPSRADCGLPEDGFVFCCFNRQYKITPAVFDVWMRVLDAAPGSVLWLLDLTSGEAKANLLKEAEARGVDSARLVFAPYAPLKEHLARTQLADVFLDTLPVCAHTTASDALWAGVPVLTCRGNSFVGRVSASLLHGLGLDSLIAESMDDYEKQAIKLAKNGTAELKEQLEKEKQTTSIFDGAAVTKQIEAAYRTIWQRHCAGEQPTTLEI